MKNKTKEDEKIIAREGNTTINAKELKTSLPKLVEEIGLCLSPYDLVKTMMLLIEVRLEIIQHILKPVLNDSLEVLQTSKETMQETNELLGEIREQLKRLKENE